MDKHSIKINIQLTSITFEHPVYQLSIQVQAENLNRCISKRGGVLQHQLLDPIQEIFFCRKVSQVLMTSPRQSEADQVRGDQGDPHYQ